PIRMILWCVTGDSIAYSNVLIPSSLSRFKTRRLSLPPVSRFSLLPPLLFPVGTISAKNASVYLEYYGLTEPPFDITPNPRFLFYSARHREAYNHLLYGLRERKGFVQLTGEVGAGKTTLCRAMLEQLDPQHYATALILNPVMSP